MMNIKRNLTGIKKIIIAYIIRLKVIQLMDVLT